MMPQLTALNLYRLKGQGADFVTAVSALASRVDTQGHPGVLSYRFFVNEAEGLGRAIVDYADAAAWIGHHERSMGWPEMKALHAVAGLESITFLGEVSPDIRDWLANSTLTATVHAGFASAAGFQRG